MLIIHIISIAISGFLVVTAYKEVQREGMILEKIGYWLQNPVTWWKKPLGACQYCTTPYVTVLMGVLYIYVTGAWAVVTTLALALFITDLFTYNDWV